MCGFLNQMLVELFFFCVCAIFRYFCVWYDFAVAETIFSMFKHHNRLIYMRIQLQTRRVRNEAIKLENTHSLDRSLQSVMRSTDPLIEMVLDDSVICVISSNHNHHIMKI